MFPRMTYREIKRGLSLNFFKDPDPSASGGGGGGGTPNPNPPSPPAPNNDPAAELAAARAEIAALKAAAARGGSGASPPADPDLASRARADRESKDRESDRTRLLESALKFELGAENFLQANDSLLPNEIKDIFAQANKEKFNDSIQKGAAIKSGVVQSFFKLQANVDLLMPGQKAALDDYLKLTKDGKEEKAQHIFEMVFEPALESLRRSKRAEALSKGHGTGTASEDAYKNKMIERSMKHYRMEKN